MKPAAERKLSHAVASQLSRAGLLEGDKPLLVAVSGGPDSLALLTLLSGLRTQNHLRLHIAHLDHGLRGPESEEDAEYVQSVANDIAIPCTVAKGNVDLFRKKHHLSWEAAAREVRYAFLSSLAEGIGASAVALGHTADDQAETVLLHLMRGSGLQGLQGMLPTTFWQSKDHTQSITLVRPLLGITREETEALCQAHKLEPRHDSSNLEDRFVRNRIRRKLIPHLKQYNPSIREALLRLSQSLSHDFSYIDQKVREVWPTIVTRTSRGLRFNRKFFLALHPSIQAHLLRSGWKELSGDIASLTHNQIVNALSAAQKGAGKTVSLGSGLRFHSDYGELIFETTKPLTSNPHLIATPLPVPGEACIGAWHITAKLVDSPQFNKEPYRAYLDITALGKEGLVRSRQSDDRFQPLGMEGSKRLKEFMIDAHIPRRWRDETPLLVSEQGVAWVVGWRIAHWARVTESTQKIVELNATRATRLL
ncbi:MAG: tRNA lysidine(34) synthetase TilS [SAR202 cluster bacterium Io17-Chloro-G3]|nr:MAG: tRNA lysidine(34) synthetase TilS [SAR202 cluster bacterium Io17-Chloro-G3]